MTTSDLERKAQLLDAQRAVEQAAGRFGQAKRYSWNEVEVARLRVELAVRREQLAMAKAAA